MPITMNDNAFWRSDIATGEATEGIVNDEITLSKTEDTVGGVRQVTFHWAAHQANINSVWYTVDAGSILLNAADVASPTTYYIYSHLSGGVITVSVSTASPEEHPALNYEYALIGTVRFKSVGGTATIYYWRTSYVPNKLFLHYIGEYDYFTRPTWIKGGGLTINATTGVVDMEELEYRRMRFEREQAAITAGSMLYEDETAAVANLELITTYSDGSAITGGKYHKLLFGVIVGSNQTNPFMVVRQGKPDTEYTSLDEARIDAEDVAGTSFPFSYRGGIFHIAYIIMKVGDASDLTTLDIRPTGAGGGGGGGGTPIADHSTLVNLGADDHPQYTLADATRTFVAQTANRVLAGPTTGVAAAPTFRALVAADMPANSTVMPYTMQSDSTTQSIANIANVQVITFNTTEVLSGITKTSTSRFTIITPGTYLITFSGVKNLAATPGGKYICIWLRVDGADVPRSNTRTQLPNVNSEETVVVPFEYTFTAGQYFELWTWGNSTSCQWLATAAAVGPVRPAVPSVIMTVNMVSA